MPPKSTQPNRIKSRRGCRRCKARRVKCDETEPECMNCFRASLQCPGSQTNLRWSTKHERFITGQQSSGSTLIALSDNFLHRSGIAADNNAQGRPSVIGTSELPHEMGTRKYCANSSGSDLPNKTSAGQRLCSIGLSSPTFLLDRREDSSRLNQLEQVDDPSTQLFNDLEISPANLATSTALSAVQTNEIQSTCYEDSNAKNTVSNNPIDLPTILIEYWFNHVCPMWSTFDSDTNYNRQIAYSTWGSSDSVFYTLQTMSAACLMDTVPHLKFVIPSLVEQASRAIKQKISSLHGQASFITVDPPIDLIFAVFALGTSLHWTGYTRLRNSLLNDARELLSLWTSISPSFKPLFHAYFCQALTYWEMLVSVVDRDLRSCKLDQRRKKFYDRIHQAIRMGEVDARSNFDNVLPDKSSYSFAGTRPNSWCGISCDVIEVCTQIFILCRGARDRRKCAIPWKSETMKDGLCDIAVARQLQQELLAMDFDGIVFLDELQGISVDTGDGKTPISHLLKTAEAYRHASLLQLHLTFQDLPIDFPLNFCSSSSTISTRTSDNIATSENTWQQTLTRLTLGLVLLLEQIPVESGSRSIQPVLYILAAAGLKFDTSSAAEGSGTKIQPLQEAGVSEAVNSDGTCARHSFGELNQTMNSRDHVTTTQHQSRFACTQADGPSAPLAASQFFTKLPHARNFILERMNTLQQCLPSKPIGVALSLVEAIWEAYDRKPQGSEHIHWLDVMTESGLQTLFG